MASEMGAPDSTDWRQHVTAAAQVCVCGGGGGYCCVRVAVGVCECACASVFHSATPTPTSLHIVGVHSRVFVCCHAPQLRLFAS